MKDRAALLGVLALVGAADVAGAITSVFAPEREPGICSSARPAAVLVDQSSAPIEGDPVPRYAPLVHLERRELHLPMAVDCFLENSELRWARLSAKDDERLEPLTGIDDDRLGGAEGGYTIEDAGLFRSHEFTRPFEKERVRLRGRRGFYLDVEDRFRFGTAPPGTEEGALTGTPVYYEFVPGRYVTYWFFYGFSAPAGTKSAIAGVVGHEGDWERVTVRLAGTTATEVAYYQHAGGPQIIPYASVAKRGTHPVVYSGLESHASYATAGFQQKFADRAGRGHEWRTWQFLADATKQPWYRYGGAWGVVRRVPRTVKLAAAAARRSVGEGEFTGPSGPCRKRPAPNDWLLSNVVAPPGPGVCAPR